jgi:hypothetical protein
MIKEARQQSGASWNDKLCMIVADEPTRANIITVIPKNSFLYLEIMLLLLLFCDL